MVILYRVPGGSVVNPMASQEADADLICEAGARWEDINQILQDKGIPLFFPVS
jgi:hypothetical protein